MKLSHIVHKVRSLKKDQCDSKKKILWGVVALIFVVVVAGIATDWSFAFSTLSKEEIKSKTEQFIVSSNLSGGRKVEVKEVTNAGNGIYRVMVQLEGVSNTIESYVTKDGTLFFPSGMKMKQEQGEKSVSSDIPQSDVPRVELFVMSYCPFGTQMEKGIIPVLETLGSSIDFKLKFVNYTLHGKKEFDENTRQYCIEKEAPQRLIGYLKCFDGTNSDSCLAKNTIDAGKINSCISATNKAYKLVEIYNRESKEKEGNASYPIYDEENAKYEVLGSPTLVINGKKVEPSRDSASLLEVLCSAFRNKPSGCSAKLSNIPPTPGFGESTTQSQNTGATNAKCN